MEGRYQFKTDLLTIHKKGRRLHELQPTAEELVLQTGVKLVVAPDAGLVVMTAVRDFEDYLFTSMELSAMITTEAAEGEQAIYISLGDDLGDAQGYMGYRITVTATGVCLEGADEVGIAQGLYYLEDRMNIRRAPYLARGVVAKKALFQRRTTQSPFGMFEFSDAALSLMAHLGFDAISLWLKDAYTTQRGDYIDLQLVYDRAKKYGIKLIVALSAPHDKHPADPGAQAYYDALYGELFERCPGLHGVSIVGESTNFHSHDPKAGKAPYRNNFNDNIPTGKYSPGWWPCCDYPEWLVMIQKAIRKHNPEAVLIFSTYNWGFAPEVDRIRLIENLPEGISVQVTWDMFHQYKVGNSVETVVDYTLAFAGPGEYFTSEAAAIQKKGLQLEANSQTSGRTWDFGVVPYEPMPGQWIKRYEGMIQAAETWGLAAICDNIHYGFHPSIITELEKIAFFSPTEPLEKALEELLIRDYGEAHAARVREAMALFDEAITHYVPTNEDQYGGFRIGPTYPLWLEHVTALPSGLPEQGRMPAERGTMFGNGIYFATYVPDVSGRSSLTGVRIFDELASLQTMNDLFMQGIQILKALENPNEALIKLVVLAEFMYRTTLTVIHVKQHYILQQQLNIAKTTEKAEELLAELEKLLLEEKKNVLATIPLVQTDSRLGWEPSMGYTTDEKGLNWKLRQLEHELTVVLPTFRQSNRLVETF